jgi:hypothetical protein
MRTKLLTLALAAVFGLQFSTVAQADITLDVANVPTTSITFLGTGGGGTFSFSSNGAGNGFSVTNGSGNQFIGNSIGDLGSLTGPAFGFNSTTGIVTGTETLTIKDGTGNNFTGTVTGVNIAVIGTGGTLNTTATVNLSGVAYTGTQTDLVNLKNDVVANGGTVAMTFQFIPAVSLTALGASGATNSTSWSGTITSTSVPEPSSLAIAGLGALGMIGFGLRRRKVLGA